MNPMKRWKFWLGLAISIAFMYFALKNLELDKFWQAMKTANYWWILPGIAVYFIGCVGAFLALALPAGSGQEDPHQGDVPGDVHRLHGQ